jgi:lysophospholipase L1-like esterase
MPASEADRRVLFFGDSIVAGVGDPHGRGWVGRVVEASFLAGLPLTAYALGVRRQTSVEVAARWLAEARPRLHPDADCRVVFAFGVNDAMLEAGAQRVDPAVSAGTLARVLGEAAQLGLPAFVAGPGPVCDPEHTARIAALSERFEAVCELRGVPFAAVVEDLGASSSWLDEAAHGDGAHPAAGGYDELARLVVAGGWLDWLRRPG